MRARFGRSAAGVAVAAGAALALSGCGGGGSAAAPRSSASAQAALAAQANGYAGLPNTVVQVDGGTCGQGWVKPHDGLQVFDLQNTSPNPAEVQLVEPSSGKVVEEVEGIAAARTRTMLVRLAPGAYAFRCLLNDNDAVTGPTVTVPAAKGGSAQPSTAAVVPVSQQDLIPSTLAYQSWVGKQLPGLSADVARLTADLRRGDAAAAKRDWLTGHLLYERLGAAYDAFGDADAQINGTGADAPGFHGIEYGLWHGRSPKSLVSAGVALQGAVDGLRKAWPSTQMDPMIVALRAHEIVENSIQFELTGLTDEGSHSNLATAGANLQGAQEALAVLTPILSSRVPLAEIESELKAAQAELSSLGPVPLASLSQSQREQLDARFGTLVESLARVAAVCDPRRTS